MTEDWIERWANGRTGWHEAAGNAGLHAHWPTLPEGARVLVPLCGKSPDLIWLARQGYDVTGVELSQIAAQQFFDENSLDFETSASASFDIYAATKTAVKIVVGDYFIFRGKPFDALYDRGALVALGQEQRPGYIRHTRSLLRKNSTKLIVTLEYDQDVVAGPPFSISDDEMSRYWLGARKVASKDDLENCPPKFREAGLREITETVWLDENNTPDRYR